MLYFVERATRPAYGPVRSARSYVLNAGDVGGWRLRERGDIAGGQCVFGVECVFQAGGQRLQPGFRTIESPLPVSVVAAQFLVAHQQPRQSSNHYGDQQQHDKSDGQRNSFFSTVPHTLSPLSKSCSAKLIEEVQTANAHSGYEIVAKISSVLTERVLRPGIQRHVYVTEVRQLRDGWTGDIRGHRRGRGAGDDSLIQKAEVLDDIADSLRRIHIHLAHQLRSQGIRIADVIADHPDARCCDRGA